MKVLSKGSGTRAVAVVLACAALQVAAQAQGPGETLTDVETRAARLGHAADVVITAVSDGDTATAVIEGRHRPTPSIRPIFCPEPAGRSLDGDFHDDLANLLFPLQVATRTMDVVGMENRKPAGAHHERGKLWRRRQEHHIALFIVAFNRTFGDKLASRADIHR